MGYSRQRNLGKYSIQGKEGFNQYRWNLVVSREKSDLPYFVHYEKFLKAGNYTLKMNANETELQRPFVVTNSQRLQQ